MNVIDSPVDALVFDYVRIGLDAVVNSLWAWIAVITAAVSLWRIRAVAGTRVVPALAADCSSPVKPSRSAQSSEPDVEPEPSTSESSRPAAPTSSGFYKGESVTKGKFVVYYEEEREDDGNGGADGEGELTEWDSGGDGCGEWWSSWEKVLEVRRGETEWYKYQNLTALSGNVVRLWDGVKRDSMLRRTV